MARTSNVTTAHDGERIAKVMARAGLASRREAEAWIAAGRVAVNGAVITSPAVNITEKDRVAVDGKPLPTRERTRLFLFHKPRGLVTTSSDPQGRQTIYGALPKHLPRLVTVGRLDLTTEGLLLLTNDGGLARALELPTTGWLRRYRVRAHGQVTQPQLDALKQGITIDGIHYGQIDAKLDRSQGANVWLTFAIREGKNREVRKVLESLGLTVGRLIRVSFGPFQLGDLPAGQTEEVKTRTLRDQLGDKLAKLAGADFSAPVAEQEEPPRRLLPMGRHPEARAAEAREPRKTAAAEPEPRPRQGRPKNAPALPFRGKTKPPSRRTREEGKEARHVPRAKPDREPRETKPPSSHERRERHPFKGGQPWQPAAKATPRGPGADKKSPSRAEGKPRGRGRPYHGKRDR